MAEQNCPDCKQNAITWHIDYEESPFTIWLCRICGYRAEEDESTVRECSDCNAKTESILQDEVKKYWWCSNCDRVVLLPL